MDDVAGREAKERLRVAMQIGDIFFPRQAVVEDDRAVLEVPHDRFVSDLFRVDTPFDRLIVAGP